MQMNAQSPKTLATWSYVMRSCQLTVTTPLMALLTVAKLLPVTMLAPRWRLMPMVARSKKLRLLSMTQLFVMLPMALLRATVAMLLLTTLKLKLTLPMALTPTMLMRLFVMRKRLRLRHQLLLQNLFLRSRRLMM